MTIQTVCRVCGAEYEAGRERIIAGNWKYCTECETERTRPQYDVGGRCQKCRKPMRDKRAYLCVTCAAVSIA